MEPWPHHDYRFGGHQQSGETSEWGRGEDVGGDGELRKSRKGAAGEKVEKELGRETGGQCWGGFPCLISVEGPFACTMLWRSFLARISLAGLEKTTDC